MRTLHQGEVLEGARTRNHEVGLERHGLHPDPARHRHVVGRMDDQRRRTDDHCLWRTDRAAGILSRDGDRRLCNRRACDGDFLVHLCDNWRRADGDRFGLGDPRGLVRRSHRLGCVFRGQAFAAFGHDDPREFLDEDGEICGYEYVHMGKFMDAIKKGMDANEALKSVTGTYGRTTKEQGAVKSIDPRKE